MWFNWSVMKAKVPKCYSLSLKASTVKISDQKLTLYGQSNEAIKFLAVLFKYLLTPIPLKNRSLGDHA